MSKKYRLPVEEINDESAIIIKLFLKSGDKVRKGDLLYSFETSKSIVEVESLDDGYINYYVAEEQEIMVGSDVCEIFKQKKELPVYTITPEVNDTAGIRPTKKALLFAKKNNLNIERLGLVGLVREKDLIPFVDNGNLVEANVCHTLNMENIFIKELLENKNNKYLPSKDKVDKYRKNGHTIGENVQNNDGSLIIGNNIKIEDNVLIDTNTYIEASKVYIGRNTKIGQNCNIVGSIIRLGEFNKLAPNVNVDISGGRFPDSNLTTGRGCLLASEVYINICRAVLIGENVALSPRSMIYTHSYWQSVLDGYNSSFGPVVIKKNSWVGSTSQILPNLIIGEGSIVMSGSVVVNDVESFTMVGGVPAKLIKKGLKKEYTDVKKKSILKNLFWELYRWLLSKNYTVQKLNDWTFKISEDQIEKYFRLIDEKADDSLKDCDGIDILIGLEFIRSVPKSVKTVFDVSKNSVEGIVAREELLIIDFFRRKGIRFYENQ